MISGLLGALIFVTRRVLCQESIGHEDGGSDGEEGEDHIVEDLVAENIYEGLKEDLLQCLSHRKWVGIDRTRYTFNGLFCGSATAWIPSHRFPSPRLYTRL